MPETRGTITTATTKVTINFTLTAGRQYIIDVVPDTSVPTPLIDSYVYVYDADKNNIHPLGRYYDDEGPGLQPQLALTPTTTQNYQFEVRGFGTVGGFRFQVWQDDYRNQWQGVAPAGDFNADGRIGGRINYDQTNAADVDIDVHQVVLLDSLTYTFDLRGRDSDAGTLDDPSLALYVRPANSSSLATTTDDNSGRGFDARIEYTATETGEAYLYATGRAGKGTYVISASEGRGTEAGDTVVGSDLADRIGVLGGEDSVSGGKGRDRIVGGADTDLLRGGADGDWLYGGTGSDRLFGDDGADRLAGGAGRDRLDGGAAADIFDFDSVRHSTLAASDLIDGFTGAGRRGGDRIDLRDVDANVDRAGEQAFRFGTSKDTGRLWAEASDNDTVILGNVDGDAAAEIRIVIEDGAVLARTYKAVDFIL